MFCNIGEQWLLRVRVTAKRVTFAKCMNAVSFRGLFHSKLAVGRVAPTALCVQCAPHPPTPSDVLSHGWHCENASTKHSV